MTKSEDESNRLKAHSPVTYSYDRGDHRRKHCWNNDRADFIAERGGFVGKCPNSITDSVAETILNQGVAEPDPFAIPGRRKPSHPKRIYGVHKGIIYEAVPTQPGKSYHGYPWRAREGRGPLPTEVIDRLRELAREQGYLDEFETWLDDNS